MGSNDEEWIREASDFEKLYELSHKRRSFLLVYQLSLSSTQPLQEGHVKKALLHLHRKCPALRVCYGERNGQTWLRYMKKEELDFQVVKDAGPEDMRDLLQTYQYNSEKGPLWCARLLSGEMDDPLALDKELPYNSHVFIGVHHGITDGFASMKVCGGFIRILNDVIDNKSVCDKEQIGYFVPDSETEKRVSAKISAIQNDPTLKQELISRAEDKGTGIPLLLKVEPPPEGEDKTCNITHVLDKATTKRFIDKCRAEGVSFHSGFVALANVATVSFLAKNQYIENVYRMCNGHLINLRRYWPAERSDSLGCHILPPLNLWVEVPKDFPVKFWNFARNLHRDLHHHVKKEYIFLREAYTKLTNNKGPDYDDTYHSSTPMQVDCTFSNLGDVTHFFEDTGLGVKPYFIGRHASLHHTDIRDLSYMFHTFRSRLIVVKDAGPGDMRDLLQTYQYNSEEGPLWCARLLSGEMGDPLALDKELPYNSHVFIGIHHGITDGFTMMKVCGGFIRILNDIIDNKSVCDKEQIGYFVPDSETEKRVSAKMSAIQNDPTLKQDLISRAEDKGIGMPLLLKVEPPPEGEDKTCNITHVLDKATTKRFIDKCRAEGVSFHSGFAALANVAIVAFLSENQYIEDVYRMCNGHLINLRRYWQAERSDSLGCHILSPLNLWVEVPKDFLMKFWDFARTLHRDLHHHVKKESIFLLEAYTKLTNDKGPDYDDTYHSSTPMQVDCTFSNLGDVTHFFEDTGLNVKPYFIGRHISLHYTDIQNFSYFFHTFRGRLIVNLHYNSKYVTKSLTQKHCNQIFSMMENVMNGTFY